MKKRTISNKDYTSFILADILRPFQSAIVPKRKSALMMEDVKTYYSKIPTFALKHSDWWLHTIDRVSRIYGEIDLSVFPDDDVASFLKEELQQAGVTLTPYKPQGKGQPQINYL